MDVKFVAPIDIQLSRDGLPHGRCCSVARGQGPVLSALHALSSAALPSPLLAPPGSPAPSLRALPPATSPPVAMEHGSAQEILLGPSLAYHCCSKGIGDGMASRARQAPSTAANLQ